MEGDRVTTRRHTRYVPAKMTRYIEGAENELEYLAQLDNALTIEDNRLELQMRNAAAQARVKAQLATAVAIAGQAATADAQNEILKGLSDNLVAMFTIQTPDSRAGVAAILAQIGDLISLHPSISHVMATRNVISEQNDEITALKAKVAELEGATQEEEPTNGNRPN